MFYVQPVHVAVMICVTLVNTQTQTAFDWLLAQPVELNIEFYPTQKASFCYGL